MSQIDKSTAPQIMPGAKIHVVKHPYHICNGKRVNLTALKKFKMKDIDGQIKIRRLHRCESCSNVFMTSNDYLQLKHKYKNYNFVLSEDIFEEDKKETSHKERLEKFKERVADEKLEIIEKGTVIYHGVKAGHKCIENNYELVEFRAGLLDSSNRAVYFNLKKCNKCGKIFMKGNTYEKNRLRFLKNYEFRPAKEKDPRIVHAKDFSAIMGYSISAKDFLTRTHTFQCSKKGHKIQDITAKVKILLSTGKVEVVEFPAAYCETCKKYFILENEFQKLKCKGIVVCKVVENEFWRNLENINPYNLNKESTLHILGYNVNSVANLTTAQRWAILEIAVDENILSKMEICSHLDYLIKRSRTRKNFEAAISKWREDREHIANYNNPELKVAVKSIKRNIYH